MNEPIRRAGVPDEDQWKRFQRIQDDIDKRLHVVETRVIEHGLMLGNHREDHDLLIKIDTRLDNIDETLTTYVTKPEFMPVRMIGFGIVAVTLTAIMVAAIGLFLHTKVPGM